VSLRGGGAVGNHLARGGEEMHVSGAEANDPGVEAGSHHVGDGVGNRALHETVLVIPAVHAHVEAHHELDEVETRDDDEGYLYEEAGFHRGVAEVYQGSPRDDVVEAAASHRAQAGVLVVNCRVSIAEVESCHARNGEGGNHLYGAEESRRGGVEEGNHLGDGARSLGGGVGANRLCHPCVGGNRPALSYEAAEGWKQIEIETETEIPKARSHASSVEVLTPADGDVAAEMPVGEEESAEERHVPFWEIESAILTSYDSGAHL
jgi:hypothetical protein